MMTDDPKPIQSTDAPRVSDERFAKLFAWSATLRAPSIHDRPVALAFDDVQTLQDALLDLRDCRAALDACRKDLAEQGGQRAMSDEAIGMARAYLVEHLGEKTGCAFFDDCIHNTVAIALQERDRAEKAEKRVKELEALLEERGRG